MSLTNETAAALAEQHFAALAAGDAALAARCIHPANVNHMAADEPAACATPGVPGFLATSAWLRLAFSDLSFEIIELAADAGRTMAHVRMSGRQTGPFVVFPPGARPVVFAPTGLAFRVRQVHVFRHRDGQHGEHIAVRDDLAMMTQLGHLPPSPRAAGRMARSALTGYRARAVRQAIRVSADAAAGAAARSDRSLSRRCGAAPQWTGRGGRGTLAWWGRCVNVSASWRRSRCCWSGAAGSCCSRDGPMSRLVNAAAWDPDAFRAFLATVMCLALPQDVLARPDITDTLERIGDKTPPPFPGPDRPRLLQLLAGSRPA